MITRLSLRFATVVMLGAVWSAACQKVPLLAPSGSTIVLTASNNAVGANGTVDLIAQVLEPSGTPPHPGTHVTFSTTLGVIEPADVTTDVNGQARATFKANGSNGTATVTAISGGAGGTTSTTNNTTNNTTTTSTPTNVVRISVGTAAVGRITLTANPSTISSNGGTATVTANVVDVNGNALIAVPVTFATSAGALGASVVNTDGTGTATTPLTTSIEATVTASVGAAASTGGNNGGNAGGSTGGSSSGQTTATITVKVNPLAAVSVSATGTHTVGSPVNFTITVTPATNSIAQIRDLRISFGDGDVASLGSATGTIVVQHVYDEEDTYSITARATDTLGGVSEGGTVIVVQGQVPVVTISFTRVAVGTSWDYTFTANVFPAGTTIVSYAWNFGDGASQTTSFNTVNHIYPQGSPQRTVTVTVTRPNGQQASSSTTIQP